MTLNAQYVPQNVCLLITEIQSLHNQVCLQYIIYMTGKMLAYINKKYFNKSSILISNFIWIIFHVFK